VIKRPGRLKREMRIGEERRGEERRRPHSPPPSPPLSPWSTNRNKAAAAGNIQSQPEGSPRALQNSAFGAADEAPGRSSCSWHLNPVGRTRTTSLP